MSIVQPHRLVSRPVQESDIPRVLEDLPKLKAVLDNPLQGRVYCAVAHCQVTDKDPLQFFLAEPGRFKYDLIINPEIMRATKAQVDSKEACISYPDKPPITVQRSHKLTLHYQTYEEGKLVSVREDCNGAAAKIAQHEIDHFEARYIYDRESSNGI